MMTTSDVAVVGGGIAGLTAAHHAALGGATVTLFADAEPLGGLVVNVGELDGFPSLGRVGGAELALRLAEQAKGLGVEIVHARIEALALAGSSKVLRSGAREWRAKRVIAATGARLRPLDVRGADRFRDHGLLQCAWCNAALYRGRDVAVVGGGDSALQEALHLTGYAASVTIVTRGERLRARQAYVNRAADNEKVSFRWSAEVRAILGEKTVQALQVRDQQTGRLEELACDGVFAYVGLAPNDQWLGELVDRDPEGGVETRNGLETRTPGLFAVGAIRSGFAGRLTNAVGDATEAAIRAVAGIAA